MVSKPPRKIVIAGCGYVGLPLALRLRDEGHEVTAWVHSVESARALAEHHFHRVMAGRVADPALWDSLGGGADLVIHAASSGRGGVEAYREVFLEGVRRMNEYRPRARRIMVSSTSVYGQAGGEWVTEESPAQPATETGRVLREAEEEALGAGAIVVRSAGIYGPGRGVLFERFRRGEAVLEDGGTRWMNQIHQADLVAALAHLAEAGEPGQVYNAVDDTPVTQRDFYAWCAGFLHRPLPPVGPVDIRRKRGVTSKRVANAKLCATGWRPLYPSFREGLAAGHGAGAAA